MEESQWVTQMTNILKKQAKNDLDNPTCIFQVPSSIYGIKQEFYTPQVMALGPYHHLRTKPYQMQKCKLDFALKAQEDLQLIDFDGLFKAIKEKVVAIRGRYDGQNISMSDDTLSCVMAIDGLFLLQSICDQERIFPTQPWSGGVENTSLEVKIMSSEEALHRKKMEQEREKQRMLLEIEEKRILQEIEEQRILQEKEKQRLMVQEVQKQQIVQEIEEQQMGQEREKQKIAQEMEEDASEDNHNIEKKIVPTKIEGVIIDIEDNHNIVEEQYAVENNHKDGPPKFIDAAGREHPADEILRDMVKLENQVPTIVLDALLINSSYHLMRNLVTLCLRLSPIVLEGNRPPSQVHKNFHLLDTLYILVWFGQEQVDDYVKELELLNVEMNLPSSAESWSGFWSQFKNLNVGFIGIFAAVVDFFLIALKVLGISMSWDFSEDEFLIPSASKLKRVGVNFSPIGPGGIKDINFDKTLLTLKLPVLKYDAKLTEVVIRNLLAYEALAIPETPKFASFIELMSSLITSNEDVDVLKANNVLPSDVTAKELVKLLEELVSSDSSKKDSSNDQPEVIKQVIEGVNEYYNNTKKVRTRKSIIKYLSVSWKVLTVLAVVLLLLLMALQTFCSVYSCPKIFHTN